MIKILPWASMPETCEVCPYNDAYYRCEATGHHFDPEDLFEKRRDDCPLKEVSEEKYFDLFDCEALERGKHWDGHTEEDVTRLLSLTLTHPHAEHFK